MTLNYKRQYTLEACHMLSLSPISTYIIWVDDKVLFFKNLYLIKFKKIL